MRFTIAAAAIFILGSSAAFSQYFDAGLQAYDAGDFATALKEWTPLAEQGDADAQNKLGVMYLPWPSRAAGSRLCP